MATIQGEVGLKIRALREQKGWKQEGLAERSGLHVTYVGGIERGERNATIDSYLKIAVAFGLTLDELFRVKAHRLEKLFNAPSSDILEAIASGFRAQVDVKGKLAELYLARLLDDLKERGLIDGHTWSDKDGVPDFVISYKGRKFITECKNLRSGAAGRYGKINAYKVEVQKTRNSKDGSNTRSYSVDHFQILAVCMFNQTGKWDFYFIATKYLEKASDSNLLKIFQPVPFKPIRPWESNIVKVLENVSRDHEPENGKPPSASWQQTLI